MTPKPETQHQLVLDYVKRWGVRVVSGGADVSTVARAYNKSITAGIAVAPFAASGDTLQCSAVSWPDATIYWPAGVCDALLLLHETAHLVTALATRVPVCKHDEKNFLAAFEYYSTLFLERESAGLIKTSDWLSWRMRTRSTDDAWLLNWAAEQLGDLVDHYLFFDPGPGARPVPTYFLPRGEVRDSRDPYFHT